MVAANRRPVCLLIATHHVKWFLLFRSWELVSILVWWVTEWVGELVSIGCLEIGRFAVLMGFELML